MNSADQKRWLRSLFANVLRGVDVRRRMQESVRLNGGMLFVGPGQIDLRAFHRVFIAAIGKAAIPMAAHAIGLLRPLLAVRGVVVGVGEWQAPEGVAYFQGGHPLPDANSFAAGQALLDLVHSADGKTLVLFLISGGASAMAEAPLDASLTHAEVIDFHQTMLHSGLPIQPLNALRKHVSALKGGRLAEACGPAPHCTLLISDAPPGMLDVVGSGPSLPDTSTLADCRKIIAQTPALCRLSPALRQFLASMPETPKRLPGQAAGCFTVLSSDSLLMAAEELARAAGYRVVIDNACDDWDVRAAANQLFLRAQAEADRGVPVCVLSAGEVTVTIPHEAGQGGRNQQWALEVAKLIARRPGFVALSAGSDGIDGNSPAAGALVDGVTWLRAGAVGYDPQHALDTFNTYPLFARLGDTLETGPTGNNLRDLRVIVAA